jgi:hypothetical protein
MLRLPLSSIFNGHDSITTRPKLITMATYPAPTPHIVRPLSPITELTTPSSARSISLPVVEDKIYDYNDESPIRPRALGEVEEERDGDGDSVYSQGSSCTVVPNDPVPSVEVSTSPSDDAPPISPPANIRPFPTPSGSLPPPPRSATLPTKSSTRPVPYPSPQVWSTSKIPAPPSLHPSVPGHRHQSIRVQRRKMKRWIELVWQVSAQLGLQV